MTEYATSDLHFGHKNIIKYCNRPWDSVEEMNEGLVRRWNEIVSPEDTTWIFGDFAMGRIEETVQYAKRLNGKKMLWLGNHDRPWPGHGDKALKWWDTYADVGFSMVKADHGTMSFDGVEAVVSHFPLKGDSHDDDRYEDHRPPLPPDGVPIVHGHVHDSWQTTLIEGVFHLNVGCDVWDYRPISFGLIGDILRANS